VLSQCTTQLILKVTNPNDLKAVSASVEGLTAESEAEIQNLPVGTALVTGVVDLPLFVTIRPRRTQHGGQAVDILGQSGDARTGGRQEASSFEEQAAQFQKQELLGLIKPKVTPQDLKLMADGDVTVRTVLVPCYRFTCEERGQQYAVLVDMTHGEVVVDVEEGRTAKLPALRKLSPVQMKILMAAHALRTFDKDTMVAKIKTTVDLDDELRDLVEKQYLSLAADDAYAITDKYILSKLSKHAVYTPVAYETVAYDEKREAAVSLDAVKEELRRFTKVLDQQECWLARYEVQTA